METAFSDRPRIVIWEVTQACALACVHCRADARTWRDPRELTTEEGLRFMDSLVPAGKPLLILTGGDPMERPDLAYLVGHGIGRGLTVALSPSATPKVTPERLADLKAAGLHRVALSLDGPDAATHDAFRRVPGAYDRTMAIAADLARLGLPLQIGTTITRHSAPRLEEIGGIVERLGAVLWSVFFLVPLGRAALDSMVSPAECEDLLHRLYDISRRVRFGIKTTEAPMYRRVVAQRGGQGVPRFAGINDAKGFAFVSHTGDVFPSGFLPRSAGNVREHDLADLYRESPLFRDLRDPGKLKGRCGACEFRESCGGSRARAYAMTGDPLAAEPLCVYEPASQPAPAV